MRKTLASLLTIVGIIALLVAFMSGYYAVISFIERTRYGPGLMFADVEIFSAITIFFIIVGAVCIWISYRIKKNPPPEDKNKHTQG